MGLIYVCVKAELEVEGLASGGEGVWVKGGGGGGVKDNNKGRMYKGNKKKYEDIMGRLLILIIGTVFNRFKAKMHYVFDSSLN